MSGVGRPALDRYEDAPRRLGVEGEPDHAVDASIADLLLVRLAVDEHDAPALELERRPLEQPLRRGEVARDAPDLIRLLNPFAVGVA